MLIQITAPRVCQLSSLPAAAHFPPDRLCFVKASLNKLSFFVLT